jgi:flagellar hook-length control protein FliK
MQAAAAVSALIKPAPTAAAGGGAASADALTSLTGPAGGNGEAQAGATDAGDAFAQALAALAGAPVIQPPPAPTTTPTPSSGDTATAPTPPASSDQTLAAAFRAGLLQAAPATLAPDAAPESAPSPSLPPPEAPPAAANAPAAIAIPAELLAQSKAQGAGQDASIPLPDAPPAISASAQTAPPPAPSNARPPQATTQSASAPIIVSPGLIPTAASPASGTAVSSPFPLLGATPVSLVVTTTPATSAIDNGQASAPMAAEATPLPGATPPTPRQPVQANAKPAADGKSASTSGEPSAPDAAFVALADRPTPPVVVTPTNPGGAGHGDHGDDSAANDRQTAASAPAQTPDGSLVTPPAALAQAQATPAAAKSVGASIAGQIADQVIKSVNGKSTRFDVALNPAGLGQVNVKVEINAAGQVTAALSFDNPHAAAEARAHAGELQQALEQAGFNLGQGGLSFDVGGQGASLARQDQGQGQPFRAPPSSAFINLADTADAAFASPAAPMLRAASGVNILI